MANYFSLFLVVLTVASGLIWLADSLMFAPKRKERTVVAEDGSNVTGDPQEQTLPWLVDTAQQIFPVIAFVLVLRSFLYEPFQIPSGSMMPTLLVGDFILVEKYAYGVKDPVFRSKFWDTGVPERGDVAVFKYPKNPSQDYIKRVIGLPGDTVIYRNKQLFIKPACDTSQNCPSIEPVELNFVDRGEAYQNFVPLEKYQDNSLDGRFWGFVPDDNLVGKAVAIWISFEFDRVPSSWVPGWIPTDVRFNRVGSII